MKARIAVALAAAAFAAGAAELKTVEVKEGGNTPADALRIVREAKKAGDKSEWKVRVAPGTYALKETLTFLPEDSGTEAAPVRWVGIGKATITGGEPVKGWTVEPDGTWSAPIPRAPNGERAYFEQLWVNGRRADRARFPNDNVDTNSYVKAIKPQFDKSGDKWVEKVQLPDYAAKVLAAVPQDEFEWAQMCVVHKWSFARRVLRGYDAATKTVETWTSMPTAPWKKWTEKETIVFFENVRSGFDAPGEWFYDAKAGKLRYRPLPGEKPETSEVLAPSSLLSRLVEFKGDPDAGKWVSHIRFEGLTFACSAATQTDARALNGPTEVQQLQAAHQSDGMITLEGARNLHWRRCEFRNTGNYAMRFNDGCMWNRVENCLMEDLGAGGIWMGSRKGALAKGETMRRGVIRKAGPRTTAFNLIDNCTIRKGGRFNPEGTGVALTHVADTKVTHCEIYDFYYTGVSVGWTWGFGGSMAQRNEVSYNKIWDLGKGIMSDMGGVYTLGTSFGTKVFNNVIHDVRSYSYGGWALYTDEGSEGITMERNLCWNTTDGGFHQHFGSGCTIRNNILAWNKMTGAVRTKRGEVEGVPCTVNILNNIVLVREGPLASDGVHNVGGVWAGNLWWDVSGKPDFAGQDWEGWKATGKEICGMYADPLFVDAEKYDFRLKPESPAFKLGFKAWDFNLSGLRKGKVSR